MNKRGRRPNSANREIRRADGIIGEAVHRLLLWGFPLRSKPARSGVCEVVGEVAGRVLARGEKAHLGPDMVERIYEQWRAAHGGLHADFAPRRLYREFRRRLRPKGRTLPELAEYLLRDDPDVKGELNAHFGQLIKPGLNCPTEATRAEANRVIEKLKKKWGN